MNEHFIESNERFMPENEKHVTDNDNPPHHLSQTIYLPPAN